MAQAEASSGRQAKQVNALRGDVLTHLAAGYIISCRAELLVEFGMEQVDLPQVGLARITRHSGKVLNGFTQVCVSLHAQARQERDAGLVPLAKNVLGTPAHCLHKARSGPGRCFRPINP